MFSVTPPDASTWCPEQVGAYELLLPIGHGGMATVFLARLRIAEDSYREVAVKLLHAHLRSEGPTLARHLLEEARIASRIRHPNVVPVLAYGDEPSGVYLVLEYVEGDSVAGLMRAARQANAPVPLPVVAKIAEDALHGLHAAHGLLAVDGGPLGLVHRDVSPQNVLVGVDGCSRITDFGIAKVRDKMTITSTGVVKGKLAYMSPEQAHGRALDPRADVFAAGVVVWELLAGRRLYEGLAEIEILKLLGERPLPRISSVRADVPRALDDALAWALASDRQERCPTAEAFAQALRDAFAAAGAVGDARDVARYVSAVLGPKLEARRAEATRAQRPQSGWKDMRRPGAMSNRLPGEARAEAPASLRASPTPGPLVLPRALVQGESSRTPPSAPPAGDVTAALPVWSPPQVLTPSSGVPSGMIVSSRPLPGNDHSAPPVEPTLHSLATKPRASWLFKASAAALLAATAITALLYRAEPSRAEGPTQAAVAHGTGGLLAATAPAAAPPPRASAPAMAPRTLVSGDGLITTLRIDGRTIVIPTPTPNVEVQLVDDGAEHTIDAASSDGRRARWSGHVAGPIVLHFVAAPAHSRPAKTRRAAAPAGGAHDTHESPAPPPTLLAPSPYHPAAGAAP